MSDPTPLVPEDMHDPEPEELVLPTNADLIANEDGNDDDNQKDGDADTDPAEGGEGADDDSTEPTEAPEPEEPQAQVEYLDDPGDFTPSDYSFEVVTYDQEGANPRSHRVKSLEDWDDLLDSAPNFGTGAAMLKAERAAQRMDRGIENDRREYERQKVEYDEAVKAQEESNRATMQWQNELDYLVAQGDLPPMPAEYHVSRADWKKPDVARQPAVKAQMELLAYFRTTNAARTKAGLAPMTSLLDAYQGMENQKLKTANAATRQQASDNKKAAAAKVSGSAPRPATAAPKGIAIGRIGALKNY